jgi:hypothetical protein
MKQMPLGLYGHGDAVATETGHRIEINEWCIKNKVGAFFYGRYTPTGKDYWIVSVDDERLRFMLRWAA